MARQQGIGALAGVSPMYAPFEPQGFSSDAAAYWAQPNLPGITPQHLSQTPCQLQKGVAAHLEIKWRRKSIPGIGPFSKNNTPGVGLQGLPGFGVIPAASANRTLSRTPIVRVSIAVRAGAVVKVNITLLRLKMIVAFGFMYAHYLAFLVARVSTCLNLAWVPSDRARQPVDSKHSQRNGPPHHIASAMQSKISTVAPSFSLTPPAVRIHEERELASARLTLCMVVPPSRQTIAVNSWSPYQSDFPT
ncbi:hypothetical protein BJ170DRAFT_590935 [Xylariales sp. AK1849]|nr:hypothetical protein BJ170DRAFT_590935 [Xylariales sp. AK1849]